MLTATGDRDGDGESDRAENLANTNPLDPNSALRITAFNALPASFSLTWTSTATPAWTLTLDNILPDAGATTTRGGATSASLRRFFRVLPIPPLSP